MAQQITFGKFNPDGGKGLLRAVNFPELARVDTETPDGRMLADGGGSTRTLPVAIMGQFQTAPGHMYADVVGTLREVTFGEDGIISGKGWLVDTDEGRKMEILLEAQALRQNSVDLADVKYEIHWKSDDPNSPDFWEYTMTFTEWKIATTTFVNVPAFPEAAGEVAASFDRSQPLEVRFETTEYRMLVNEEVRADGAPVVSFDDFHQPEPRHPQPWTIDENGVITGHLAEWGKCHGGIENRCILAPRPVDYSQFHEPGVLTDRGIVETGPVFLLGGHPAAPLGTGDRWAAYGGVENAIGDVRVVNGRLGPWCSGRVRPGVSPEALYAARASRVSGHWRRDGSLAAIVHVNVPGYKVPGTTLSFDSDGGIVEDGELVELVASLHVAPPDPLDLRDEFEDTIRKAMDGQKVHQMVWKPRMTPAAPLTRIDFDTSIPGTVLQSGTTMTGTVEYTVVDSVEVDFDFDETDDDNEAEAAALELELELAAHLPFKT